jgi:hypothetical protein
MDQRTHEPEIVLYAATSDEGALAMVYQGVQMGGHPVCMDL